MTIMTEEQAMLKDAASAWVLERAPVSALRSVRTTHAAIGYDPQLYSEMVEMGWTGVVVPEEYGGYAFGYSSFGMLAEQLGRHLTASPLLSSALTAATLLVLGGSEEQKSELLPKIVSGETIATLALDEGTRHAPAMTGMVASVKDGGWTLNGVKRPVLDGMAADLLIVAARTEGVAGDEDGITLFLCPSDAPGVTRRSLRQIDSRGAAIIEFDNVALDAAAVVGTVGKGFPVLDRALDRSRVALAAEMLGSASQAFDTTVEYLKTRVQFGHPIGSFQALQHRAADMVGTIALIRSAVQAALAAIDSDSDNVPELASLAKALAGKTLKAVAREMVQMHGGIGVTDEHDAGLYLKRAQAADMAFGNEAFHRERYAALIGI